MTADEARKMTVGLDDRLQTYINQIDEKIKETAMKGGRVVREINHGVQFNRDLATYYRKQGFEISHCTSPWDNLSISW